MEVNKGSRFSTRFSGHTWLRLLEWWSRRCARTQAPGLPVSLLHPHTLTDTGENVVGRRRLREERTLVLGTMLRLSFWSTREAPASERYPWFGTRQERPKQQGQHSLCIHLVHLGFSRPYGSSSFGLKTPIFRCVRPSQRVIATQFTDTRAAAQITQSERGKEEERKNLQM